MIAQGCEDLLEAGGDQILPVIPCCVQPLKRALNTRDKQVGHDAKLHFCNIKNALENESQLFWCACYLSARSCLWLWKSWALENLGQDLQVMIIGMRILQKLVVSAELIGQALVPYYRQVLGPFHSCNKLPHNSW